MLGKVAVGIVAFILIMMLLANLADDSCPKAVQYIGLLMLILYNALTVVYICTKLGWV